MKITSSAFQDSQLIPKKYTCDDADISPPLMWQDFPDETQSFVLIVDDPDAPRGTWDHWIVFNIPKTITHFDENIQQLSQEIKHGQNSWRRNNYGGPCPPQGEHRYFFKIYALDKFLDLENGATKKQIETAMMGHILADAQLIGKYRREGM